MISKTRLLVVAATWALGLFAAEPTITINSVAQRYPWNGLVDVSFTLTGGSAYVSLQARDLDGGTNVVVRTMTEKESGNNVSFSAYLTPGSYNWVWNAGRDLPEGWHSENIKMLATANSRYMVVDLSGGANATSYPVSYLDTVPSGGWTSAYKTTKMVLRLVPPGEFVMGSPAGELGHVDNETQHPVCLTQPFYIGVFQVTQKQYTLIAGSNPSNKTGDVRPVENISYNIVRGSSQGSRWPLSNEVDSTSFIGKIRARTGLAFDLPTEAQWEYACRAGTTTALNSGKNLTGKNTCSNLAQLGRYGGNRTQTIGGYSDFHTTVGSFLSNAWALYDMHGNIWEYCLDWFGEYPTTFSVDPPGVQSGTKRSVRGGRYSSQAFSCRSACRGNAVPSQTHNDENAISQFGLRLSLTVTK